MLTAPSPGHRWHTEVPGTRWFRADLHLHTLDDPVVELPPGITGHRSDATTRRAYAIRFLDAAIEQGIEILGLTPHAAFSSPGVSATWDIVELWETGAQPSTGTPYRDLVYAVFPGFEPNFADGNNGIHLIFLFDSAIGKDRYQQVFSGLMGGRPAYNGKALNCTQTNVAEAFALLDDVQVIGPGNYLTIAAHPLQDNGLLRRPAHYVTDIAGGRIQAAELRRNKTLEEDIGANNKLRYAYERGRVALYHCSDAVNLPASGSPPSDRELGFRFTVLKMATPTLEALRQALLGHESRLRVPYLRDAQQRFAFASLPTPCPTGPNARPWLRELKVTGGTSFLRGQTFRLSPDLTCVIGGSMTGKSTLLDGLRVTMLGEDGLPARGSVRDDVDKRARSFLSGNPQVDLESPTGDLTRPVPQRFGMRFFSQSELKGMADNPEAIEHLLFHLVPGRAATLLAQRDKLRELDTRLQQLAEALGNQQERVGDAEQAFQRVQQARKAMERFAQAGTAALPPAQQDIARAKEFARTTQDRVADATALVETLRRMAAPPIQAAEVAAALNVDPSVSAMITQARQHAANVATVLDQLKLRAAQLETDATSRHQRLVAQVQQALVTAGGSAEDLNAFEAFARAAQHYDSYKAALDGKVAERQQAQDEFRKRLEEREQLVALHREAITAVCTEVGEHYEQRVRVVVDPEGRRESLQRWVEGLRQRGISRWWNGGAKTSLRASALRPALKALDEGRTADAKAEACRLDMTATVADTLLEVLAPWASRMQLWALRCPDRYRLQWVESGVAKDLDQLSGGRKVAVLLALLLESDDPTPLVVDQPEDELDNRFLNETIIPVLHRLKGKRQVIFATHNANIVVNGDADRVIALEADAQYGRVYAEGAIEDPQVREAILKTLDGGKDAFRLRRAKYGF
ncbi:MAG: hypothetical protein GXP62_14085 [Oligoflexia bacterium]|nr:hypothetical protein [Oligoflexia bacterium]